MSKFAIRLLTLATIRDGAGHGARRHHGLRRARQQSAAAAVGKNKKKKSSEVQTRHRGHRLRQRAIARPTPRSMTAATMLPRFAQLKALGRDDSAAVANLIGYSYRKLGDYKVVADLVRARAEGRPQPRQDLAVLRPVAGRTGQPRSGAVSPEPDRGLDAAPAARNIARWPRRWKSRPAPGLVY